MVIGSFVGGVSVYYFGPLMGNARAAWLGILLAMLAGTLFSVLHAFASINLNADQTISGTAINLMAGALVLYISRRFVGTGNIVVNSMTRVDIPVLKDIPVIGKLFLTDTYPTTWFVLVILIVSWFVIERTPFGLRLRSCGEFPEAADAAGISVARIRYAGVLLSGACAGLGGAIYTVTTAGQCNGLGRRTRLPRARGAHLRPVEALPHPGGHPLLRLCGDDGADLHAAALLRKRAAAGPQGLPLRRDDAGARRLLQVVAGAPCGGQVLRVQENLTRREGETNGTALLSGN